MTTSDNLFTDLHQACKVGDKDTVEQILQNTHFGKIVDQKKVDDGTTCLHMAAYSGSLQIIKLLLHNGANISLTDNEDFTIVHWAIKGKETTAIIKYIIKHRAGSYLIKQPSKETFFTPLMCALFEKRCDALKVMLKHDGEAMREEYSQKGEAKQVIRYFLNFKTETDEGKNVLHLAATIDDPDLLQILIDRIEKQKVSLPKTKNFELESPILLASKCKLWKNVKLLLKNKSAYEEHDINIIIKSIITEGNYEVFYDLLTCDEIKANIKRKFHDEENIRYIFSAVTSKSEDMIELLVKNEVDITLTNEENNTVLHVIASKGLTDMLLTLVRYLPEHEMNQKFKEILNIECESYQWVIKEKPNIIEGCTALHLAALELHFETLHFLLLFGADPYKTNKANQTPLKLMETIIEKLSEERQNKAHAIIKELDAAMKMVDEKRITESMLELIQKKLEGNVDKACGDDIANKYYGRLVKKLQSGVFQTDQTNKTFKGRNGRTKLHLSVLGGDLQATRKWLQEGIGPDIIDSDGKTAMCYAIESSNEKIVNVLLEFDASMEGIFHIMAYHGKDDLFKKYGNQYQLECKYVLGRKYEMELYEEHFFIDAFTILEVACLQGHFDFVKYLNDHHKALVSDSFVKIHGDKIMQSKESNVQKIWKIIKPKEDLRETQTKKGTQVDDLQVELNNMNKKLLNGIKELREKTKTTPQSAQISEQIDEIAKIFETVSTERNNLIIKVKQEVLGTNSTNVDEMCLYKLFSKIAQKFDKKFEPNRKESKWQTLFENLLKHCPAETVKGLINKVSSDNNNDSDCAFDCLMYWKDTSCFGNITEERLVELQDSLNSAGITNVQVMDIFKTQHNLWKGKKTVALNEKLFLKLACDIGHEWWELGTLLGFTSTDLDNIENNQMKHTAKQKIVAMLVQWNQMTDGYNDIKSIHLTEALAEVGKMNLAAEIINPGV